MVFLIAKNVDIAYVVFPLSLSERCVSVGLSELGKQDCGLLPMLSVSVMVH